MSIWLQVEEHTHFGLPHHGQFPLELANKAVPIEDLQLYAFKVKQKNRLLLWLRLIPITKVPKSKCPDVFKNNKIHQFFCGKADIFSTKGVINYMKV